MAKEVYGAVAADDLIAVRYGSRPTDTGAAVKTFTANAYAFTAKEATTITHFTDENGNDIVIGWESKVIAADQTVWFGCLIKEITVIVGGLGEYYLAESDL